MADARAGLDSNPGMHLREASVNRRQMGLGALVLATAGAGSVLGLGTAAHAAKAPTSWDGLVKVKSKKLDAVYLAPYADFRPYTKVMLDPTEVAFEKNWRRDYNSSSISLAQDISESELQKLIAEGVKAATDIFAEASQEGGFPVVEAPAPDAIRLRTGILDIRVSAPDRPLPGRSYSFSNEAGSAVLVVEVRDSMTGALMGRAVDGRIAGDTTIGWRNKITNRSDFRRVVKDWAKTSIRGLQELKTLSPVDPAGLTRK